MSGKYWTKRLDVVGGCTEASEGCLHCWLRPEAHMRRHNPVGDFRRVFEGVTGKEGRWTGRINLNGFLLDRLAEWKEPQVVQVWSDLFHEKVPFEFALKVIDRFAQHPRHTALIGTKRPKRAVEFCAHYGLVPDGTGATGSGERIPENVWLLATVENEQRLEERIGHILRWPGKRALSLEPLVGAVNLTKISCPNGCSGGHYCSTCMNDYDEDMFGFVNALENIHQVVAGGETGRDARPMGLGWIRTVRDQCQAAGVPFYFKGWGEYSPYYKAVEGHDEVMRELPDGKVHRVGRKKAGRLLDGREHNELAWGVI